MTEKRKPDYTVQDGLTSMAVWKNRYKDTDTFNYTCALSKAIKFEDGTYVNDIIKNISPKDLLVIANLCTKTYNAILNNRSKQKPKDFTL